MRMMGDDMGTPRREMVRMSVIRRSVGLELVLVFCGYASRVSDARTPAASAPAVFLKKSRRPRAAPDEAVSGRLFFVIWFSSNTKKCGREFPARSELPIKLHRYLHPPRGVRLRAPQTEVGVLEGASSA